MSILDLEHMAWVLVHGGFDDDSPGGCSCQTCRDIRILMDSIRNREAEEYVANLRLRDAQL